MSKLVKYAIPGNEEDAALPSSALMYPRYHTGRLSCRMTVRRMYDEHTVDDICFYTCDHSPWNTAEEFASMNVGRTTIGI